MKVEQLCTLLIDTSVFSVFFIQFEFVSKLSSLSFKIWFQNIIGLFCNFHHKEVLIFLKYFSCEFTDMYNTVKLQHRIYITVITISSRLTICLAQTDDVFANYNYWLFKINTMIPFYIYSTVLSRGDRITSYAHYIC